MLGLPITDRTHDAGAPGPSGGAITPPGLWGGGRLTRGGCPPAAPTFVDADQVEREALWNGQITIHRHQAAPVV